MLDPGHRGPRPFGQRRPDRSPDARPPEPGPAGWDAPARPPGPLPWALRTAAIVGFAALLATQYLARTGDAPARVALASRADPETTGSIGGPARATRLDPCALAAPARPRPSSAAGGARAPDLRD